MKANEGHLYLLPESLLFLPKPPVEIPLASIAWVKLVRWSQNSGTAGDFDLSSRTFDLFVSVRPSPKYQDVTFSNLNKEEAVGVDEWFRGMGIRIRKDDDAAAAGGGALNDAALGLDDDGGEDESEGARMLDVPIYSFT